MKKSNGELKNSEVVSLQKHHTDTSKNVGVELPAIDLGSEMMHTNEIPMDVVPSTANLRAIMNADRAASGTSTVSIIPSNISQNTVPPPMSIAHPVHHYPSNNLNHTPTPLQSSYPFFHPQNTVDYPITSHGPPNGSHYYGTDAGNYYHMDNGYNMNYGEHQSYHPYSATNEPPDKEQSLTIL